MKFYQHRFARVEDYLHHRPPYLLVDHIDSIEEDRIQTRKTIDHKDPLLGGHFPGAPIFPGALMQELSTQTAGILIAANFNPMPSFDTSDPHHNEYALGVLVKVSSARYKYFARPSDILTVDIKLIERVEQLFEFSGRIRVKDRDILRIQFSLTNIKSSVLVGG